MGIDDLIQTGLIDIIAGVALLLFAYLLPGIYRALDNKEGIKLLEEREAFRQGVPPRVRVQYITVVVFWPWANWEQIETHQNWASYIKKQGEDSDDNSNGNPPSSEETGKGGD